MEQHLSTQRKGRLVKPAPPPSMVGVGRPQFCLGFLWLACLLCYHLFGLSESSHVLLTLYWKLISFVDRTCDVFVISCPVADLNTFEEILLRGLKWNTAAVRA